MSVYLGDFNANAIVYASFMTFSGAGASITFTGTTVDIYKDATKMTTPGGITLSKDVATGRHRLKVDMSADANYTAGSEYEAVMDAITVDSQTVNLVIARWSVANRSALRPATAGRTLVVDASGLADANTVKVGPTGSGTAQTARDLGASVLLSSGTGTGQVSLSSGVVQATLGTVVKSTQLTAFPFFMVDSADHVSGKTGLTVTAERSIDGGAFAACANAVAEIGSGWYKITLATTDLAGDTIALKFTAAGADPTEITVIPER